MPVPVPVRSHLAASFSPKLWLHCTCTCTQFLYLYLCLYLYLAYPLWSLAPVCACTLATSHLGRRNMYLDSMMMMDSQASRFSVLDENIPNILRENKKDACRSRDKDGGGRERKRKKEKNGNLQK